MENLPVVDVLEHALGLPVLIEKDVGMSLFYDKTKYGLNDCRWLCGIYFGTGIGNAIFAEGKLLAGRNGAAGELVTYLWMEALRSVDVETQGVWKISQEENILRGFAVKCTQIQKSEIFF